MNTGYYIEKLHTNLSNLKTTLENIESNTGSSSGSGFAGVGYVFGGPSYCSGGLKVCGQIAYTVPVLDDLTSWSYNGSTRAVLSSGSDVGKTLVISGIQSSYDGTGEAYSTDEVYLNATPRSLTTNWDFVKEIYVKNYETNTGYIYIRNSAGKAITTILPEETKALQQICMVPTKGYVLLEKLEGFFALSGEANTLWGTMQIWLLERYMKPVDGAPDVETMQKTCLKSVNLQSKNLATQHDLGNYKVSGTNDVEHPRFLVLTCFGVGDTGIGWCQGFVTARIFANSAGTA